LSLHTCLFAVRWSEAMDENIGSRSDFGDGGVQPARNRSFVSTLARILIPLGIVLLLLAMLLPAVRNAGPAAERNACSNNMKMIALAILNYADKYHELPPAYTVDANGKPLHSWRTLILPFLEEEKLYESIDLSKPWNDPANAKAFNTHMSPY